MVDILYFECNEGAIIDIVRLEDTAWRRDNQV